LRFCKVPEFALLFLLRGPYCDRGSSQWLPVNNFQEKWLCSGCPYIIFRKSENPFRICRGPCCERGSASVKCTKAFSKVPEFPLQSLLYFIVCHCRGSCRGPYCDMKCRGPCSRWRPLSSVAVGGDEEGALQGWLLGLRDHARPAPKPQGPCKVSPERLAPKPQGP